MDRAGPLAGESFVLPAVPLEEIERLTVPEGLSDVERAQLYAAGDPVQQHALIENLPGLAAGPAGAAAFAGLGRQLTQLAFFADEEGQEALADAFAAVLRRGRLPAAQAAELILPLALPRATDPRTTPPLLEAWLGCLKELVRVLEPQVLRSQVVPAVIAGGAAAGGGVQSVPARCLSCRLLGLLAPALPAEAVDGLLLQPVVSLCQDTDCEVRQAMCSALPAVAAALTGRATALGVVIAEALQLLEDEEVAVRSTAWPAWAEMLQAGELVPASGRRAVLALFLHKCRNLGNTRVDVHRSLTAVFGVLMGRLVGDMEGEADVGAALGGFRSLAWRHDTATRRNCAAAFLPVLRAATPRRYASHLHDTLVRLASDPEPEVRQALAGALHEVAALLGKERCVQYLRPSVAALLGDECRTVQAALAPHLVPLLEQFQAHGQEASAQAFNELLGPLLQLEAASGHDWRVQLDFLRAAAELPRFYPGELLHERVLPVVVKHMEGGAASLLGAAADAAAALWRAPAPPHLRTALYGRLAREFAQGRSWRRRAVFLDFCQYALRRFSARFFKAHLLGPCSLLAFDAVPNVQLRACELLPTLKQIISLPADLAQLEQLNAAMAHLLASTDPDVTEAALRASQAFKQQAVRTPVGLVGGGGSGATDGPAAAALAEAAAEFERQDGLKQLGEKELGFEPEALDRIRADMEAYDRAHRPPPAASLALTMPAPCPETSSLSAHRTISGKPSSGGSVAGSRLASPKLAGPAGGPPAAGIRAPAAPAGSSLHRRVASDTVGQLGAHQAARQPAQQRSPGVPPARATSDSDALGPGKARAQLGQLPPGPGTAPSSPGEAAVPSSSGGGRSRPAAPYLQRASPLGGSGGSAPHSNAGPNQQPPRRATSTGVPHERRDSAAGSTAWVSKPAVPGAGSARPPQPSYRRATSTGVARELSSDSAASRPSSMAKVAASSAKPASGLQQFTAAGDGPRRRATANPAACGSAKGGAKPPVPMRGKALLALESAKAGGPGAAAPPEQAAAECTIPALHRRSSG